MSTLKDRKSYHHGDLRRALLTAAGKMLERDGPTGVSLRAAARRAGVSPAAPYRHFRGKEELLAALAVAGFDELARITTEVAAPHAAEPLQKAYAICRAYVEFSVANPQLYRLMFSAGIRALDGLQGVPSRAEQALGAVGGRRQSAQ